jgi:tetratricopeptide (TPR) repeat protein
MEGRWKFCLAGGLLAGAVGCTSTPKQHVPSAAPITQQATAMPVAKAPPPPPPAAPKTSLKPDTYVTMGAMKEEAAEAADRLPADRDALRHEARQSYQKAIEVDPKHVPAYIAMAKSYWASGEKDKAQAMFAKASALAPNDANLWYEEGAAQARAKDFPAAVQSLTRAAQLDPANKNVQKLLGFTLARGGWYEESLNALVKAMPEAEARYNLARMMQHNGQGDAADVQLRLAAQMNPSLTPARAAVGGADAGVRQVGYQAPVAPAATNDPQPIAPAQLPPVMLGER